MNDSFLLKTLENNAGKNFVQRIINREDYPVLPLANGEHATHLMSWAGVEDKFVVFPTVLYEEGKLNRYPPDEAIKRVMQTGDYIEFDDPLEAGWFSENYKRFWEIKAGPK